MLRLRLHVARTTHGGRGALAADHADALELGPPPQERPARCAGVVCALESLPCRAAARVAPDPLAEPGRSATPGTGPATGVLETRGAAAGESRARVADRT